MAKRKIPQFSDKFARMVQRGFQGIGNRMATRGELLDLQHHIDVKLKGIADALERLERDTLELQEIVRPLARLGPEHEERLRRVERKVGLVK